MKNTILLFAAVLAISLASCSNGFLKVEGKQIVEGNGKPIILRGIGLGGWMLQEPYMLQLSDVAGTQPSAASGAPDRRTGEGQRCL